METNVNNFEVLIDISSTETPDYEKLCVLNVDYDQGETLDTWNDLCNAISNSVKTVLDPTWSMSFKFDKTSPVAQFIIGKEYAVGAEATAPIRIVNKLKNKQIDFTATLSGITYSATAEEVLQIDFDLKVYDNGTFAETTYAAPSV
ncbi:MAG: hypothetical protein PHS98_04910 [Bacilli bacterium]|nr:hypothetical protein [Bacilli bacterium]